MTWSLNQGKPMVRVITAPSPKLQCRQRSRCSPKKLLRSWCEVEMPCFMITSRRAVWLCMSTKWLGLPPISSCHVMQLDSMPSQSSPSPSSIQPCGHTALYQRQLSWSISSCLMQSRTLLCRQEACNFACSSCRALSHSRIQDSRTFPEYVNLFIGLFRPCKFALVTGREASVRV